MKNFATKLIIFLGVILLSVSCDKENNPSMDPLSTPKISVIKLNNVEQTRFYYNEERLVEYQSDYNIYDPVTDSTTLKTDYYFLEYENDKLIRVYNDFEEKIISYIGSDMTINNFHHQLPEATMRFKDYQDIENFRVEIFYEEGIENNFSPTFDTNQNFLFAFDDHGIYLEDAYPGFFYLSQYYGVYSYNEMNNHVKNLDLEVQLFLLQKPFNHCVESIERLSKRIEYKYIFDENQYPIQSEAMTIYPASNDTLFHGITEYIYE